MVMSCHALCGYWADLYRDFIAYLASLPLVNGVVGWRMKSLFQMYIVGSCVCYSSIGTFNSSTFSAFSPLLPFVVVCVFTQPQLIALCSSDWKWKLGQWVDGWSGCWMGVLGMGGWLVGLDDNMTLRWHDIALSVGGWLVCSYRNFNSPKVILIHSLILRKSQPPPIGD